MVANNPAGRLVAVLRTYEDARQSSQNGGTLAILENMFGPEEPWIAAARSIALVAEVADAAEAYAGTFGDDHPVLTVARYSSQWAAPFLAPPVAAGQGWSGSGGKVSDDAMFVLQGLDSLFSATSSEGRALDDQSRQDLRDELNGLIDQVRDDDSLDRSIRALILKRLHQIATALDHLQVSGPGALDEASQLLLAAVAIAGQDKPEVRTKLKAVVAYANKVYMAVAFVGATGDAAVAIGMATEAVKTIAGGS